jgi:hypothetical protein
MNAVPKTKADEPSAQARYEARTREGATFSSFHVTPLRHNFHDHPLMQLPRLGQLAKELNKTEQCGSSRPASTRPPRSTTNRRAPMGATSTRSSGA